MASRYISEAGAGIISDPIALKYAQALKFSHITPEKILYNFLLIDPRFSSVGKKVARAIDLLPYTFADFQPLMDEFPDSLKIVNRD